MLNIVLSATDDLPAVKLSFEHSLVALSKWESIHEKPFFGREAKDLEETKSYITQMLLTEEYPVNFFDRFTEEQYHLIADYINSNQTATTFGMEMNEKPSNEVITSELIYYWLTQFQIPFWPTETWHINRLMTLVKVVGVKQAKPKKMNKQQMAEHYRKLNEQRKRESGSAG